MNQQQPTLTAKPLAAMLSALIPLMSTGALADSFTLEEVVVTAQKRAESLQDVPISVSAMSGDKMAEAGIDKLADLTAYVPNLQMTEAAIGTNIFIRGIGSGINQGFEQSVGTYVDGIYHGRAQQARSPFLDLERVEVLRGPQGILFGKNSIAGALNIVTAKPTDEFEGSVDALYAPEDGEVELTAVISGPLTDKLRGRLAVRDYQMDGWMKDTNLDQDATDRDEQSVRGTLVWDATENLELILKAESGSYDIKGRPMQVYNDGGVPFLQADTEFDKIRASDVDDYSENDSENITFTANYLMGEHSLTFVSGYSAYEYEEFNDLDFSPAFILNGQDTEDFEQFSQEIRLASPGGETVDYIAGIFYQQSDLEFSESLDVGPTNASLIREFITDTETWALFAQATWNLNESLRITGGLRYTREEKEGSRELGWTPLGGGAYLPDANQLGLGAALGTESHFGANTLENDRTENSVTPMVNVQYDLNADVMLYASASTGFKAGGYDARANITGSFEFEEEEATAFEIGGKTSLFNGAAELNVAYFYTEYEDLQTSAFDGAIGFTVGNAAKAQTQGVELDGRWRVSEGLTLSGAMAWLDFEFDEYTDGNCARGQTSTGISTSGVAVCDYTGRENNFTPEWSANLSAEYVYVLGDQMELRSVVDANFVDNQYIAPDLDPLLEQGAYTKFNARIALSSSEGWELALVGKNLTDKMTASFANDVPLTGLAPAYFAYTERGRSWALQGSYRF